MTQELRPLLRILGLLLLVLAGVLTSAARADMITYFHNDPSGSPVAATDENGRLLWKETYRPYGERLLNGARPDANRLWFTGKPQDPDTGLSYLGARYYSPQLGRFMGIDPKAGDPGDPHSFNRYAYANNNPYKFVDPDGNNAAFAIEAGIGGTFVCGPICGFAAAGVIGVGGTYATAKLIDSVFNESNENQGTAPRSLTDEEKERLSDAGKASDPADPSGRTKAGRSLQKKGSRDGSAFPTATGTPEDHNAQGQEVLDGILNDSDSTIETDTRGRTTVTAPDGRSVRYNPDGSMQGFREP